MKVKFSLTLLLLWVTLSISAQGNRININKYKQVETGVDLYLASRTDAKKLGRQRDITINPMLQEQSKVSVGDTLELDLFNDKSYTAYIDKVEKDINGVLSVRARILGYNLAYCFITTTRDMKSVVDISIPELNEVFIIEQNYLQQNKKGKSDVSGVDIPIISAQEIIAKQQQKVSTKVNLVQKEAEDVITINVMVVYTPAARDYNYDNMIHTRINRAMGLSQLVLDNSSKSIRLNLVHSQLLDYKEIGDYDTDLVHLEEMGDGQMDEVHALRYKHGADLVVLLTKTRELSARSFQLNSEYGKPALGFSVVSVQLMANSYAMIYAIGYDVSMVYDKIRLRSSSIRYSNDTI